MPSSGTWVVGAASRAGARHCCQQHREEQQERRKRGRISTQMQSSRSSQLSLHRCLQVATGVDNNEHSCEL
eukprot:1146102-Pelagomonas_calceolata.AAC.2